MRWSRARWRSKPTVRSRNTTAATTITCGNGPRRSRGTEIRDRRHPLRFQRREARKLSFKERKELESLPARIEALETQIRELHEAMADPVFYERDSGAIVVTKTKLAELERDLATTYGARESWRHLPAEEHAGKTTGAGTPASTVCLTAWNRDRPVLSSVRDSSAFLSVPWIGFNLAGIGHDVLSFS